MGMRPRPQVLLGLLLLSLLAVRAHAQTVSCTGIAAWSATTSYSAGAKVTYQGSLYEALVGTTNVPPNYCPSCGWWRLLGVCGTPTDTTTPSVPTGLAVAGQTSSSVSLAWNASTDNAGGSGVAGYDVFRNGALLASPTLTSFTNTGIPPGTYTFTVRARDVAGNASAQSPPLSVTIGEQPVCTTIPSVPTGLVSPSQTSSSASLSWNASTAPTGCTIQYRVFQNGTQVTTVAAPSATISGLAASTAYSFTVAATDQAGTSVQSTALAVTTSPGGGADCSAVAAWVATTTYNAGDKVTFQSHLYTALTSTTNVPPNHCPSCGWWRDDGACGPTLPTVPSGLASPSQTKSSIALTWNASTDVGGPGLAGYDVFRNGAKVASPASNSHNDTGLALATTYTYQVRSRDTAGAVSALSAPLAATTKAGDCTTVPLTPTGLASPSQTSSCVNLQWNSQTPGANCSLQYRVFQGSTLVATVSGTSASVCGLISSTTYSFTIAAITEAGASAPTAALSVKTAAGRAARVGYFVQWGIYGRQYFVRNLDTTGAAAKLTHINYAFSNLDPVNFTCMNGVTQGVGADPQSPTQGDGAGDAVADYARPAGSSESVDGVADVATQKLMGNFNQLLKLKRKHPHLKVLISLGGWTYSKFFSDAAASDASRKKFVGSCIDLYIKGNLPVHNGAGGPASAAGVFDGIDIDWEYPGTPNGHPGNHWSPNDKSNFVLLMQEFRTQLNALPDGGKYLLTAFGTADPEKLSAGWDLPGLMKSFNFINVQGYDFHGSGSDNSWEPNRVGHQGNLFVDTNDPYSFHFSVDLAIQSYLNAGVNPRQLTVGIPFYGRGWQGVVDGGVHGEWQTATGAACGQFGCDNVNSSTRNTNNIPSGVPGCTVFHDTQSIASYCYTGNNGQWWTYDDTWAITQKMSYVKSKNLLGAMIWEMSGDDGALMTAIDSNLP
jgi:chitinase